MTKDDRVNVEANVPGYHMWVTHRAAVTIAKAIVVGSVSLLLGVVSLQVYGIPKWQKAQDERYDKRMEKWSDGKFFSQIKGTELIKTVERLTAEVETVKSRMETGIDEIKAGINDLKLLASLPSKPVQHN